MPEYLHIICLDIPYPLDYGGTFDMYYKIRALHEAGVHIHLHCFKYGREKQPILEKYCEKVFYYPRNYFPDLRKFRLPFIVSSRRNKKLLKYLKTHPYPILMEGVHSTYYLLNPALQRRKILVRLHNVEYIYYQHLAQTTRNLFQKIYYKLESKLLKRYEQKLCSKARLLATSRRDESIYRDQFHAQNIHFLPAFLPMNNIQSQTGKGSFALYHGNLSVPENEKAVLWLLEECFTQLDFPLVIAGKNPSVYLKSEIAKSGQVRLVENPDDAEMNRLIREAHIHVLPSFNRTGIKIKLLLALCQGRFIITNEAGVAGTPFRELCTMANTGPAFKYSVEKLREQEFTIKELDKRKRVLLQEFDNAKNVEKLMQLLFNPKADK